MNLPNLFSQKKTNSSANSFLAILLTDQCVHSALWRVSDGQLVVSHRSQLHYFDVEQNSDVEQNETEQVKDKQAAGKKARLRAKQHLQERRQEKILVIDRSLQDLGPDSEQVEQVVFGFEPSWVNRSGILATKKDFLKQVTEDLALKAVGYVVTTEALYEHLMVQNPLLSSVLLYVGQRYIDLSLIQQGELLASQQVGRSQDLVGDLREAIARFLQSNEQVSKLPPHVILTSGVLKTSRLQRQQQQLIDQQWAEQLNFMQAPVIQVFAQERLIDVVVLEGGQAVAQAQGLLTQETKTGVEAEPQVSSTTGQGETGSSQQLASFGVPVSAAKLSASNQATTTATSSSQQPEAESHGSSSQASAKKIRRIIFAGVAAGVLALLAGGYLFLRSTYSVLVTVLPASKSISRDAQIRLDSTIEQTNAEELILKASTSSEQVTDSDQKVTTGVKLVGEKAEGELQLYNKTEEEKELSEGTTLTSGDLEFKLTEDVTIPAATVEESESGEGEVKDYGQTKTTIKAAEIGAEANISEETELKIADFATDTYEAQATEDFEGGSSREIRVVSEQDRQDLFNNLRQELIQQAKNNMQQSAADGQYVIPTDQVEVVSQQFSAEVGDEVEELSLEMTLEVQGLAYTVQDLKPLAVQLLSAQVPAGYQLVDEEPNILSQPAQQQDTNQYSIELNLSSQAEAQLNSEHLKQSVLGQPLTQAQAQINQQPQVEQVQIRLKPHLSQWVVQRLPQQPDRVYVKVK
jgi:hypothetical protein